MVSIDESRIEDESKDEIEKRNIVNMLAWKNHVAFLEMIKQPLFIVGNV